MKNRFWGVLLFVLSSVGAALVGNLLDQQMMPESHFRLWWSGELDTKELLFYNRLGKILQFVSGLTIVYDIAGQRFERLYKDAVDSTKAFVNKIVNLVPFF